MLNALWALASLAGGIFRRLFDWLKTLNIWQLLCIALALFAGFQTLRVSAEQRHSGKLQAQLSKLAEASKQKQTEVREVIKQGKDRIVVVRKEAERIESAPLEGDCKTPKAVLEADV